MTRDGKTGPDVNTGDSAREWVVMLHARSSVRLLDDPHIQVLANPDSTVPLMAIRLRNGFFKSEDDVVFKGLIVEARGMASTAEAAVALLAPYAAPYLHIAATAANASVDEPTHLLAYAPPTNDQIGRFVEQRPCDERLPAATVRSIGVDELSAVIGLLLEHPEKHRLHRAMEHYRQALRALDRLNRVVSAEHLYLVCENLGHVVFRRVCRETNLPPTGDSKHRLAVAAGFEPIDQSRQHLNAYDSHLRVEHIFGGDRVLYKNLRGASDAFEHGFGGFGDIQAKADASADAAFACVRRAILREVGVAAGSRLFKEKYAHALAGWSPLLKIAGNYKGGTAEGWPYFYGASLIPEITAIEDLDGDQKRQVTFRVNASGASLLDGQDLTVEETAWALPMSPDREPPTIIEREVVVTQGNITEP